MKALEKEVLKAALEIQDELLGPTNNFNPRRAKRTFTYDAIPENLTTDVRDSLHAVNGLGSAAWFFHSPLLYWRCSADAIENDQNILATVNEGSKKATTVNVTLRHSIVFSGKRFEDKRLVAADALVVTLLHKVGSPVGRQWESNAEALVQKSPGKWRIYPSDGRVKNSQLYEFRFQPLSFQDDILLATSYGLILLYFLLSLTKLRALKSRFGLSMAVITQIAFSVMSSFTICAVLKIDLSKIPREAYPLVVLTVGLENIFRLINAVILTPSEIPTAVRLAEALGETSHIALAGAAQNLFILWLLAKAVSPGVAAFCVFAAIALIFDFVYLMTFFVAVLSVEVRRTELSDSLEKGRSRSRHRPPKDTRESWIDAILRGNLPVSTRISGTIVMIGFVLIAQWHFFDHESPMQTASRLTHSLWGDHKAPVLQSSFLSTEINQARTPTAWLRLQDHKTAQEVIQVIKPTAHSYVAQVFEPLIFVLEGSDRNATEAGIRPFLPAAYDFAKTQITRFIMTVLFIGAVVSLLMNYLLWGEDDAGLDEYDDQAEEESLLAVKSLSNGHRLDIMMLTAAPEGVIVSVGLDRQLVVWDIRQDAKAYRVDTRDVPNLFPIYAVAVDDHAGRLAILSANGELHIWDIRRRRWSAHTQMAVQSRPLVFNFASSKADADISIMLVRPCGSLSEVFIHNESSIAVLDMNIYNGSIARSILYYDSGQLALLSVSRDDRLSIASSSAQGWTNQGLDVDGVTSVVALPALKAILAVSTDIVRLVDYETHAVMHTFGPIKSKPDSVCCFYSLKKLPNCGNNAMDSFSLIYTDRESEDCILQTYIPARDKDVLCINPSRGSQDLPICLWNDAVTQTYRTESPGIWEVLPIGAVVGIRKTITPANPKSSGFKSQSSRSASTGLRKRSHSRPSSTSPSSTSTEDPTWETWLLTAKGERFSVPLCDSSSAPSSAGAGPEVELLVNEPGPITRVGQRSIAVGFGNVLKVITVGHERFTVEDTASDDLAKRSRRRRRDRDGAGGKRSLVGAGMMGV
jgi:hypothetical protein